MEILSVFDPAFKSYGKVITGMEETCREILDTLAQTPLPDATGYVPTDPALQELPAAVEVSENLFGGMPAQLGWCNGHNTKLNCLEYHRTSEFNLGARDFILLLAKREQIVDGKLDIAQVKAFRAPAGTLVEVYATTLHYTPCMVDDGGFQVMIALPAGTNGPRPEAAADMPAAGDSYCYWKADKWVLCHADSPKAAEGGYVGLTGKNLDITVD